MLKHEESPRCAPAGRRRFFHSFFVLGRSLLLSPTDQHRNSPGAGRGELRLIWRAISAVALPRKNAPEQLSDLFGSPVLPGLLRDRLHSRLVPFLVHCPAPAAAAVALFDSVLSPLLFFLSGRSTALIAYHRCCARVSDPPDSQSGGRFFTPAFASVLFCLPARFLCPLTEGEGKRAALSASVLCPILPEEAATRSTRSACRTPVQCTHVLFCFAVAERRGVEFVMHFFPTGFWLCRLHKTRTVLRACPVPTCAFVGHQLTAVFPLVASSLFQLLRSSRLSGSRFVCLLIRVPPRSGGQKSISCPILAQSLRSQRERDT